MKERQEALRELRTVFAKEGEEPLSQRAMAVLLDVDYGSLNRWEAGRQVPNDRVWCQLPGRLAYRMRRREITRKAFDAALDVLDAAF